MTVQVTPSLAVTRLDALPYLIAFPYSSSDQTISRFVPLALVRRTLKDLGMKPADVQKRVFGGIEAAHASVVFPAPEGPASQRTSPASSSKSTTSRARRSARR